MNSLIRRLILILKVWIAKLFEPAADPRTVYAAAHQRQTALLAQIQDARSKLSGTKTRLEGKVSVMEGQLPTMENQARQALGTGDEHGARLVLQRRHTATQEIDQLRGHIQRLDGERSTLAAIETRLAGKVEAYFARQETFAAQYDAAEARAKIGEALSDVAPEFADLGKALEQAEERAEGMQARADAIDELTSIGVLQLQEAGAGEASVLLDSDSDSVERLLSEMKRDVASGLSDNKSPQPPLQG